MIRFATILALVPALYAAPPLSFTPHYLDIGPDGQSYAVAADAAGNIFTASMAFEPSGRGVIRIVKTDPAGAILAQLDYGPASGSLGGLQPVAIAADAQGNLVLAGNTIGTPVPLVSALISSATPDAAFLAKFDPQLRQIIFSTEIGGQLTGFYAGTSAGALALDSAGNIYLAGATNSTDFPVTAGAYQTAPPVSNTFGSAVFAYVAELPPDGSRFLFSTYFGGNTENCYGGSGCLGKYGYTNPDALALDSHGNIVIAGSTTATDLPVTAGTLFQQCDCPIYSSVSFAAKIAAGGASLLWSTYINGGPGVFAMYPGINVTAVALDGADEVLLAGNAPSGIQTTPGVIQPDYPLGSPNGGNAGFLIKIDPTASQLLFSTYFGIGSVNALALDPQGAIWLTGTSDPADLPAAASTPALGPTYVAEMSIDGQSLPFLMTMPAGAAGQALMSGPVVLGPSGSLLLPGTGAASLAGITSSAITRVAPYVAPYDLVSFYGWNLGPSMPAYAQVANGVVTTSIGGVQVLFDGVPAPLLYAGSTQINAVVPHEVAGRDFTQVQLITPVGSIDGVTIPVRPSDPQIFQTSPGYAAALNQDGSLNSQTDPAPLGSVVAVWATGGGLIDLEPTDGAILQVAPLPLLPISIFAPDSLEVLYAGIAPGDVAGVLQINFRVPTSLPVPAGALTLELQVGAMIGDPVAIYVGPPPEQ